MPIDFTKETEEVSVTKIYLTTPDGHRFSYPLLFSVIETMQLNDCYEGVSFDHEDEEEIASYLADQGYLSKHRSNRYGTVFNICNEDKLNKLMEQISKIVSDKQIETANMLLCTIVSFINRFTTDESSAEEVGENFTKLLLENQENPELIKAASILTQFTTSHGNYINNEVEDIIISMLQEINHWSKGYCYHDDNGNEHTVGHKYRVMLAKEGIHVDPTEY